MTKKRKTIEKDAAFYIHMLQQGGWSMIDIFWRVSSAEREYGGSEKRYPFNHCAPNNNNVLARHTYLLFVLVYKTTSW